LLSSPWPHVEKVLKPLISSLIERYIPSLFHWFAFIDQSFYRDTTDSDLATLRQLLISPNLSSDLLEHGCSTLVASVLGGNEDGPLQELLSELYQRHPVEIRTAIKKHTEEDEEDGKDEDSLIASLSLVSWSFGFQCARLTPPQSRLSLGDTVQDYIVMSTHHEPSVRAQGVRKLLSVSPVAEDERVGIQYVFFQLINSRRLGISQVHSHSALLGSRGDRSCRPL